MENLITTVTELETLYGGAAEASIRKEVDYLHPHYQAIIQSSPFAALATAGGAGLDVSPRGDAPGFIKILNDKTLILPDSCLLYTSPSPRDRQKSRMPSSA